MYRMRFSDSVTIEKKISKDASHKVTYGTAKTVKCALQTGLQNLQMNTGKENIASAWIAFPPDTDVAIDDRITLPDGTQPHITSVSPQENDITKKVVYIEVYLTKSTSAGGVV